MKELAVTLGRFLSSVPHYLVDLLVDFNLSKAIVARYKGIKVGRGFNEIIGLERNSLILKAPRRIQDPSVSRRANAVVEDRRDGEFCDSN